jgi:hypothetical protein
MSLIDKKYQVFVSSTYEDLQAERQEVMHALLELDCIPSGMELFPAANEDQWTLIKGVIDDCDYYIVIIGGRYGSIGPPGISYTEMEYRYAVEIGKPVLAFLHKDPESIAKSKSEREVVGQEKLDAFRSLAKQKMVKYWENPKDLGSVVSRSLIVLQKTHPGVGWVRGDQVPTKEASVEILSLKKEIDKLKNELNNARTQVPEGTENLAKGNDKVTIHYSFKAKQGYSKVMYEDSIDFTWDEIFYTISPYMINEAVDRTLRLAINSFIEKEVVPVLRKVKDFKEKDLIEFIISEEDFQTIKVQLKALGLISKSSKSRSVKDIGTYWALTPYGDEVMTKLRAIRR